MEKSSKSKIEIDDIIDVGSTISSNSNIIFVSASICVEAFTGEIDINLGTGKESATIWTCDLTKEYIKINADYRS